MTAALRVANAAVVVARAASANVDDIKVNSVTGDAIQRLAASDRGHASGRPNLEGTGSDVYASRQSCVIV